ncbi:pyridoxamine 5'-phosphate oxidase family protein [Mycolicibacterium litorale]|uniref:pyridoxamine 5'-phosphate oxidase family protein n=1 Tax=Mycolicibacterium litorale TaxID=758802 RepID=UPI003CF7F0C5
MPAEQRMAFLSEPRVGVLAVEWDDRAPLSVPVWYDYELGGEVFVWTYADSVKHRLIRAAGRFSLTVQEEVLPYRFVAVQGPVTSIEPGTSEMVHRLASRYLSEKGAQLYVEKDYEPSSVTIRMRPERWLSGVFLNSDDYA